MTPAVYVLPGDDRYHLHGGVEHNPNHEGHTIDCMCDMTVCGLVLSQGRTRHALRFSQEDAAAQGKIACEGCYA